MWDEVRGGRGRGRTVGRERVLLLSQTQPPSFSFFCIGFSFLFSIFQFVLPSVSCILSCCFFECVPSFLSFSPSPKPQTSLSFFFGGGREGRRRGNDSSLLLLLPPLLLPSLLPSSKPVSAVAWTCMRWTRVPKVIPNLDHASLALSSPLQACKSSHKLNCTALLLRSSTQSLVAVCTSAEPSGHPSAAHLRCATDGS